MKKLPILILLFITVFSFSQTEKEKQEIINTYDLNNISELLKTLEVKNIKNEEDISNYLRLNPDAKRVINDNGKISEIKYIINNNPIYVTTHNVNSAIATRTNFLHNGGGLGLNIEGQNMHVATWDGGPTLVTHVEFQNDDVIPSSRVDTPDASASNPDSEHSTHVSGTIIAKGISPNAKGMAPKATLTSYDWDFDDQEALIQATTNGLLLSNHSYGVPTQTNATLNWMMGCYNTEARTWDDVAYNAPNYLQVVSAGNDGLTTYTGGLANNYDKLVGNKNSKNNLVVANAQTTVINPDGSGNLLSLFINSGSSQGPTDDGRVKPDITGRGTNVYSAVDATNNSYNTFSGTSMSAPNVTGTLLLLQQYYNQLNSQYMRASTLKGLACHTVDDDSQSPGPDPIYGWGLLNAKRAAETINADLAGTALIKEVTINQGETHTIEFTASSSSKLSATLCWTDPPGFATTTLNSPISRLINDLDLRITNSTNTYFPWKLDIANVQAWATTGDNLVDTVEKIDIANPTSGSYTLTVSHKGTLTNGSQTFSIILTGANLTLGIDDQDALNDFVLWPNPVNDELNFKYNSVNSYNSKVTLVDIQGRTVFSNVIIPEGQTITGNINTSEFSSGIYILNIEQGDAKINKKVIIE